ncbi:YifB family Mg chelatase-like AAA ATPase [Candidatus Odyssella thessalonicensis]|uniref:YifB family Mg chelatase-like AAA ATPase n=1 Tax=Candidatus Odyssella thessalonicensis TaxID=84647 RepID=UPI000225ABF7|nr:YifB family Mg chelatase-like AAA ATPase [Candidatus Odyssella thessalonicensis]
MVAKIHTVSFAGIDVLPVDVQVQFTHGLPGITIVGLPDKTVAESKERIRSSFQSIGLDLPAKRVVVNLAPADIQKEGSHYDLPIAIGMVTQMGILDGIEMAEYVILGELGLDGSIARVAGSLPAAIHAASQDLGLICPALCGSEAAWAGDLKILAAPNLISLVNHFKGIQTLSQPEIPELSATPIKQPNLKDVKGQMLAKRALEVAAAGGHNLLMVGPPGSGKSMLSVRLPGILPPLTPQEALEITMIHSLNGELPEEGLLRQRPYREPHHSASLAALVGGGIRCKPGEVSLAHKGVLFLDELPEFNRNALEALRQPLETGKITVARANSHITYPAQVQLVAAMNPCRCGFFGDKERECARAPRCAGDYQSRISGPLMDRFDIVIDVPEVKATDLLRAPDGEDSSVVVQRVAAARIYQYARLEALGKREVQSNATVDSETLEEIIDLSQASINLLSKVMEKFKLSGRGYHRILRVARTIADLEQSATIETQHLSEAVGYRRISVYGEGSNKAG